MCTFRKHTSIYSKHTLAQCFQVWFNVWSQNWLTSVHLELQLFSTWLQIHMRYILLLLLHSHSRAARVVTTSSIASMLNCLLQICAESVQTSEDGARQKLATTDSDSQDPLEFCSTHKLCLHPVLSWWPPLLMLTMQCPLPNGIQRGVCCSCLAAVVGYIARDQAVLQLCLRKHPVHYDCRKLWMQKQAEIITTLCLV